MRCYPNNYRPSTRRPPNDELDEDGWLLSRRKSRQEERQKAEEEREGRGRARSRSGRKRRKSPLPPFSRESSASPPPPPPPPYEEEEVERYDDFRRCRSFNQRLRDSRSRDGEDEKSVQTATSTLITDDGQPTRSSLLTNQLMSSLEEDRRGPQSPASVFFPSHNMASTVLSDLRHELAELKADWSAVATDTVNSVQDIVSTINDTRQERAFLRNQISEKHNQVSQLRKETESLYSHLAALEKVAKQRNIPWVRPPFIRSAALSSPLEPSVKSDGDYIGAASGVSPLEESDILVSRPIVDEKSKSAVKNLPYTFVNNSESNDERSTENALYIEVKPVSAVLSHIVPPPSLNPSAEDEERRSLKSNKDDPYSIDVDRVNRRLNSHVHLSDAALSPKRGIDKRRVSPGGKYLANFSEISTQSSPDVSHEAKQRQAQIIADAKAYLFHSHEKRASVRGNHVPPSPASLTHQMSDECSELSTADSSAAATGRVKSIMKSPKPATSTMSIDSYYREKMNTAAVTAAEPKKNCLKQSPEQDESVSGSAAASTVTVERRKSSRRAPPPPPPPTEKPKPRQSALRGDHARSGSPLAPLLASLRPVSPLSCDPLSSTRPMETNTRNMNHNSSKKSSSSNDRMTWKQSLSDLMSSFERERAKSSHRPPDLSPQSKLSPGQRNEEISASTGRFDVSAEEHAEPSGSQEDTAQHTNFSTYALDSTSGMRASDETAENINVSSTNALDSISGMRALDETAHLSNTSDTRALNDEEDELLKERSEEADEHNRHADNSASGHEDEVVEERKSHMQSKSKVRSLFKTYDSDDDDNGSADEDIQRDEDVTEDEPRKIPFQSRVPFSGNDNVFIDYGEYDDDDGSDGDNFHSEHNRGAVIVEDNGVFESKQESNNTTHIDERTDNNDDDEDAFQKLKKAVTKHKWCHATLQR